ncbi:MAG: hypothetical protein JKX87_07495 [Cycloclasticus sp.]|nr:hypothetical protein [Cycloclasticus sp.]
MTHKSALYYSVCVLFIFTVLSLPIYAGEVITLTNKADITHAYNVNTAMANLSSKVMECIDNNGGEAKGCTCTNRVSCPFKKEYDYFTKTFCHAVSVNPDWKNENVFYQYQENGESVAHNLASSTIYRHLKKTALNKASRTSFQCV